MKRFERFLPFLLPVFVIIWHVVNCISNNYFQITLTEKKVLIVFLAIFSLFSILLSLIARLLVKNEQPFIRTTNILVLAQIAIFHYGDIGRFSSKLFNSDPNSITHILIFLTISIGLASLNWIFEPKNIYNFSSKLISLLLLMSLATLTFKALSTSGEAPDASDEKSRPVLLKADYKPNIYYIILDGYAGGEALKKVLNFDNSNFLNSLRDKGFYIADKSFANYPMTFMSLGSSLNMDYMVTEGIREDKTRVKFQNSMAGNNRFVKAIHNNGYQYVHFENKNWSASACGQAADQCIPKKQRSTLFGSLIISKELNDTFFKSTIFYTYLKNLNSNISEDIAGLNLGISHLNTWYKKNFKSLRAPFFLFAHTLSPHTPWIYNKDCSPFKDTEENILNASAEKNPLLYAKTYLEQIPCLNIDVLKLVQSIEEFDPEAIVVIQSDHGSSTRNQFSRHPLSAWSDTDILERYSNLTAIKVPKSCQSALYPRISPVNNLRLVLNCLGSDTTPLLPDNYYYSNYEDVENFERIEKIEKMPEI